MDAREFLSRGYLLEQQVEAKLYRLESLRAIACRITPNYSKDPVSSSRKSDSLQDTIVKIVEAEEELNREIDNLIDTKRQIAAVISRVHDVVFRIVLEKRHLCFKSWNEMAGEMSCSVRWIKTIYKRAIRAVQEILDEDEKNQVVPDRSL